MSQPEWSGLYPRSSDPSELRNTQIEQARNLEALMLRMMQLERTGLNKRAITLNTAIASAVAGAVWGVLSYLLG